MGGSLEPPVSFYGRGCSMLSRPSWLLRIEEAGLLAAAILIYGHMHLSWVMFGLLFLAPDLFMLGYLVNARVGAATYNLGHFLLLPLVLFGLSYWVGRPMLTAIALIWFAHIALDRMLGYGLKYPAAFTDPPLQHVSRHLARAQS
jgi:hypothetical protein